jgi:hypothetical protein
VFESDRPSDRHVVNNRAANISSGRVFFPKGYLRYIRVRTTAAAIDVCLMPAGKSQSGLATECWQYVAPACKPCPRRYSARRRAIAVGERSCPVVGDPGVGFWFHSILAIVFC